MSQRKSPSGQTNSAILEEVDSFVEARQLSHKPKCIRINGEGFYVLTENVWNFEDDSNPDNGSTIIVVNNDESGDAYVLEGLPNFNGAVLLTVYKEASTSLPVEITPAGTVTLLTVLLTDLQPSTKYVATIGVRTTIYQPGAIGTAARPELIQDVYIDVSESGTATLYALNTSTADVSKCAQITSASTAFSITDGGFVITATQSSEFACKAQTVVRLVDLLVVT